MLAALISAGPAAAASHRAGRASSSAPEISLVATPSTIVGGHPVTLSGRVENVPAGSVVRLYKSPYPYRSTALVRTATPAADGSFSFTVFPDRNARYRAIVPGTTARADVQVLVSGRTSTNVKALPLGQARVAIVVFHPRDLRWGGARIRWAFGTGFRGSFTTGRDDGGRQAEPLRDPHFGGRDPAGGAFPLARVLPRSRRPRADQQPPAPGLHGARLLRRRLFAGRLPVAGRRLTCAPGSSASRAGRTAFAVVDSEGRMSGVHEHWTFVSASVVKAMLLVAYLRRLDARGQRHVDSFSNSFLYPMINVSDNSAATQTWSIVGDSGLYSVAHAAGMTDFSIVGIWANAQISAADQAKFFFEMDSLIPREFVGYARFLLSTIAGFESWGIPAVARPRGYTVFFKGGWRGTGLGQLVHQVGRLEGHGRTFSMAVMTDGDPSMGYGIGTIQGVTGALL